MLYITTFGFRWRPAPEADFVLDLRRLFRDPLFDAGLRQLTGHDQVVFDHVLATPGILDVVVGTSNLLAAQNWPGRGKDIWLAVGCGGGRHRAVSTSIAIAADLKAVHSMEAELTHLDIGQEVLPC